MKSEWEVDSFQYHRDINGLDAYLFEDSGKWAWCVVLTEPFVLGPYPGTPDWRETDIGEGYESTFEDAEWKAIRCIDRAVIKDQVFIEEEYKMYEEMYAAEKEWEESYNE